MRDVLATLPRGLQERVHGSALDGAGVFLFLLCALAPVDLCSADQASSVPATVLALSPVVGGKWELPTAVDAQLIAHLSSSTLSETY